MISFSTSTLLSILGLLVGFSGILIALMSAFNYRRGMRYDDDKHRIELEMMRRSIETQMYGLNEKLVATEERWKDVNHLLISSQNRQADIFEPSKQVVPSSFLMSAGLTPDDLEVENDLVFVLTPFHPIYKAQFVAVDRVCSDLGLHAMRGDEEYVTGDIFPHILRLIIRARIIVAIIDGRNPNVFYELGIAHALGKQVILVSPTPEDVPFDLRTKRLVLFDSLEELSEKMKDELARVFISKNQPAAAWPFPT